MPVQKKPGDEVIGATLNQEGLIKVKATRVGNDTFLAQVIKMVEEYQGTKVPIQEFADKITGYFVPAVLLTVLFTFIYDTFAIHIAILGLLHPVIAELCMAMSSITVVANANLLRRAKIHPSYLK